MLAWVYNRRTMKTSIAVLVSGGLDSDVLLTELASRHERVFPVYIRQGLFWETAELYWLKKYLTIVEATHKRIQPLTILSSPMDDLYGDHWSTGRKPVPAARSRDEAVYLPGRNMVLSVKAAVFCVLRDIGTLALGSLGGNPFPDARPAFFRQWGKVLSSGLGKSISIVAPYRRNTKQSVIRRGRRMPLQLSFSCIDPIGRRHCGMCNKCAERRRAFRDAGVIDQTDYATT